MKRNELVKIQKFVGAVTEEQLVNIDCFVGDIVALFMPVSGPCYYAVTPEHTHPSYMVNMMFDNTTQIVINKEEVIPSQHGMFSVIAPNIVHHEVYSGNVPKYIIIMISPELFEAVLSEYDMNEFFYPSSNILNLIKKFMLESGTNLPGKDSILGALSLEICHDLIRSIVNVYVENDTISERIEISRAIIYIHTHLNERITVDQIADSVNMSTSHFSRVFREEMQQTPSEYLQCIRLERVKKLLVSSKKTITEIALESGFNSSAYLSTLFMKKYNLTPTAYKRKLIT